MAKLLLIRGLPGTGKSTLGQYMKDSGDYDELYEADQFFESGGRYIFVHELIGEAHAWCHKRTFEALDAGKNVVVCNTFTTWDEVAPYVRLNIQLDIIECRNERVSIHDVPAHTLERMRRKFVSRDKLLAKYWEAMGQAFSGQYHIYNG